MAALKWPGTAGRSPERSMEGFPVRSIGWLSEKGGVGKSTCAVNTAVALAKRGKRILFLDCDPQSNATMIFLAGQGGGAPTLYHVLANEADAADAVVETGTPGLHLIPADSQ